MKKIQKLTVVLLTLAFTLSLSVGAFAAEDSDIEAFVTRFYVQILNRQPDEPGLAAWSDNLRTGREAGANVGYGFIQSDEFSKRNLGNEEYIRVLYRAFFDREADEAGLSAWLGVLESGLSRLHVYRGFAESAEFTELCSRYGISRGSVTLSAPVDQNENVTKFVVRCYRLCLGRNADNDGLNAWCSQILTGANSAKEAAYGFVFSSEFRNKNLSNAEYVRVLYRVFMDREADDNGLNAWVKVLENGKSREHVFNGFADSSEFHKLCEQYGIYAGEPSPEEPDESWKNVYVEAINDFIKLDSGFKKFALFDINNDNVPELILSTHIWGGSSNVENVIYTVESNKLLQIDVVGGNLGVYTQNGISNSGHNMNGYYSKTFYRWENNQFVEIGSMSGIIMQEDKDKFYLGSDYMSSYEVSKETFDDYILEKIGKPVSLNVVSVEDLDKTISIDNIHEFVTK